MLDLDNPEREAAVGLFHKRGRSVGGSGRRADLLGTQINIAEILRLRFHAFCRIVSLVDDEE